MNVEEIRDYVLTLPDVEETMPFGPENIVFKIGGKMFLLLSLDSDPVQFNVKCDPDYAVLLRENYPSVLPGYHMNKKHWNTILADETITNELLRKFIVDSYELVKKKLPKAK